LKVEKFNGTIQVTHAGRDPSAADKPQGTKGIVSSKDLGLGEKIFGRE
jgi:hypothetical protein